MEVLKITGTRNNRMETTLNIQSSVYHEIEYTLGSFKPERGGILGGRDNIITHYYLDSQAESTADYYIPDNNTLNKVLEKWDKNHVSLYGIIHSHPDNCTRLSYADKLYAQKFMENNGLERIILFIVISVYDAPHFSMLGFEVLKKSALTLMEEVNVIIIS